MELSAVAEVRLLAPRQAQPREPTGVTGTAIMPAGTGIIFTTGVMADAGSALQVDDRTRCQAGIAAELAELVALAATD